MRRSLDQIGHEIILYHQPKRIVSLVPSITELIADLGLREAIVGCTKFCIYPDGLKQHTTIVGGTKTIDINLINRLNPDLIIANKEENPQDIVCELGQQYPVWVSDVKTLSDSHDMILGLGKLLQCQKRATVIVQKQHAIVGHVEGRQISAAYLIWRHPYMTVGGDTYIHDLMNICGFRNVFGDRNRYPEIQLDDIKALDPKLVLLSSEPYPFGESHKNKLQELFPDSQVCLVDGAFFSWYGSRLLHMSTYRSTLYNLIL